MYKLFTNKKINTNEGNLFMVFRDWDEFHEGYQPKMVYATTINPRTSKGPILHKQRDYFLTAISGKIAIELLDKHDQLITVNLFNDNKDEFNILMIESGNPIRILNLSDYEVATVINCASKAWHPNNQDTWKWNSWEEYKSQLESK
jgi:hypothetical protein